MVNIDAHSAPNGVYLDAETNGLYGRVWAVCAVRVQDGVQVARFEARQAGYTPDNPWVQQNCFPHNEDLPEAADLHAEFAAWWLRNKGAAFAHMGAPVEAGLFRALHERGLIGDFDGPYPLHDLATALFLTGEPADSIDSFIQKHGVRPAGSAHDCRYDVAASIVAAGLLFKK